MKLTRRELLRLAASTGIVVALPAFSGCGDDGEGGASVLPDYVYSGPLGPETIFEHGVASGDPLTDGVVLWTRARASDDADLDVFWEVAVDADFQRRLAAGWSVASATGDFSVKLDVRGLQPGTNYYYRFLALGRSSRVGRTSTAPTGPTTTARFAVVSCSNFPVGYFHSYRSLARRDDLNAVIHLGDYIYEGGGNPGAVRLMDPRHEILTLSDYRRRYAHYRRDPDLQDLHARFPFITVWDDHESANNSWRDGAENHTEGAEGAWQDRKAAAQQAYAEWMPLRTESNAKIFRSLKYGDLVDLVMLDTRLWGRDEQALGPNSPEIFDEDRTLLGDDQEAWFHEQLQSSTARWRLIGQQVVMGQVKTLGLPNSEGVSSFLNEDQWDGYQATRQRFFNVLRTNEVDNVVVLTGDIHASACGDLMEDPNDPDAYDPITGRGALAAEFVTPAVTSSGLPGGNQFVLGPLLGENPHIKFADLERRGYLIVDVTDARVEGSWYLFERIDLPEVPGEALHARFEVRNGENKVTRIV